MEKAINDTIAGVKLATLVFSFIGAACSLSYGAEMTKTRMALAIVTGMGVAVSAAPLALHYLGLDDVFERGVSFLIALLAMRGVPVLFSIVDRVRGVKIPGLPDAKE